MDHLVSGQLVEGIGLLMQRFQAAEFAAHQGWQVARHLEGTPDVTASATSRETRDRAVRFQQKETRTASLLGSASH